MTSRQIPLYWQPVVNATIFRYLSIGEELRMETMLSMQQRFPFSRNARTHFKKAARNISFR